MTNIRALRRGAAVLPATASAGARDVAPVYYERYMIDCNNHLPEVQQASQDYVRPSGPGDAGLGRGVFGCDSAGFQTKSSERTTVLPSLKGKHSERRAMSLESRHVAPLVVGLLGAASVGLIPGPSAAADPPSIPEPGSESAAATISDLDAAGYDVNLQFENGAPNVSLSQCTVTDINTVGSAGSQPTAYVTINCPK